jgi:7-keto-8-aminopelargonate synthetase-like enzyme
MSLVRTRLGVPVVSPIIPLVVGSEAAALGLTKTLLQAGFHVPAIRPPTVPAGECHSGGGGRKRKGMGSVCCFFQ